MRRMLAGMSQDKLGESLHLTFQQIQKYEKGSNRISASRLYDLSRILEVPVQFFFEELPEQAKDALGSAEGFSEAPQETMIMDFLNSSDGLQLNKAFSEISDPTIRRKVVDLVKAIAGHETND